MSKTGFKIYVFSLVWINSQSSRVGAAAMKHDFSMFAHLNLQIIMYGGICYLVEFKKGIELANLWRNTEI